MRHVTLRQLCEGGAIRMLCMHHATAGRDDPDWVITADFARREFRAATKSTIAKLIARCKVARKSSVRLTWNYRSNSRINGGGKAKKPS